MVSRSSGSRGVPCGNNWGVCGMPIAGFVLRQKLFVQMDIGATLCFLGMGGWFDCSRSCCPGFGPQVSFKPHRSRVAFGLSFAPGEECVCVCVCVCVCCVLFDEDIFVPVVEKCAPCMSGGVGLGRMAVF